MQSNHLTRQPCSPSLAPFFTRWSGNVAYATDSPNIRPGGACSMAFHCCWRWPLKVLGTAARDPV